MIISAPETAARAALVTKKKNQIQNKNQLGPEVPDRADESIQGGGPAAGRLIESQVKIDIRIMPHHVPVDRRTDQGDFRLRKSFPDGAEGGRGADHIPHLVMLSHDQDTPGCGGHDLGQAHVRFAPQTSHHAGQAFFEIFPE
jgi:hypothetical protein